MAKLKVKKPKLQSVISHSTRNGMGRRISGFATTKMQSQAGTGEDCKWEGHQANRCCIVMVRSVNSTDSLSSTTIGYTCVQENSCSQ